LANLVRLRDLGDIDHQLFCWSSVSQLVSFEPFIDTNTDINYLTDDIVAAYFAQVSSSVYMGGIWYYPRESLATMPNLHLVA
jgi:hypothetical protein